MRHIKTKSLIALSFILLSGTLIASVTANAQDTKLRLNPIKIDGFQYRYIAKANLHMNICKNPACGRGSKVSYIFLKNKANPSFEVYTHNRRRIANILRQRTPAGTTLEFEKPKVRKNSFATVFSQMRKATNTNGQVYFTMTTMIYTPIKSISLISSSSYRKFATANRAKFGVPLTKMLRKEFGLPAKN